MLKKILKYDLSGYYKFMYPFFGLAIFFALLTRLFLRFEGSLVMQILGEIVKGACFSMFCSALINNFMRLMVRFRQSMYGDESYLLHTLPVRRETVYDAKMVTVLITTVSSFLLAFACMAIMFLRGGFLQNLKEWMAQLTQVTGGNVGLLAVGLILLLWVEFVNLLQCAFSGIILGNRRADKKFGFSFLFAAVVFLVTQGISSTAIAILAIFHSEVRNLFTQNQMPSAATFGLMIWVFVGVYALLVAGVWAFNRKALKRGVDVE